MLRSLIVLPLLIAFATLVFADNKCDKLNAAAEVIRGTHYRQFIQESQSLQGVQSVFVQHQYNVNFDDMSIKKQESGSMLARANVKVIDVPLFSKDREYNIYNVLDQDTVKGLFHYQNESRDSTLFGVSNAIEVSNLYKPNKEGDSVPVASVAVVPVLVYNNETRLSEIYFTVVDVNQEGQARKKIKNDKGDEVEVNAYPLLAQAPYVALENEPMYNVDGQVLPGFLQNIRSTQVDQSEIDLPSVSHQKILAVKLLSAGVAEEGPLNLKVDFIAVVNTAGSIKLARYQFKSTIQQDQLSPAVTSVVQVYHKVVVPFTALVPTNGAVIAYNGNNVLSLSTALYRDQIKSFTAFYAATTPVTHMNNFDYTPYLMTIDLNGGNVQRITEVNSRGFPADIACATDNQVILGVNSLDIPSNVSQSIDVDFVSHILTFHQNDTVQSGIVDGLTGELSKTERRFVIYSVAGSPDHNAAQALVGGTLVDSYTNQYKYGGHLSLVRYAAEQGHTELVYNLGVGDGSAVLGIRKSRAVDGESDSQTIFLSSGAPDHAPPANPTDDKERGIKANFWLTDCNHPSERTEYILTIVFYTLFSVVCFAMVVAILGFTIKGVLKYRESRDERRTLLM